MDLAVVVDPLLVELGFCCTQSTRDGLSVHLARPLVIRPVGLGGICPTSASWRGAVRVAPGDTARGDQSDLSQLSCQLLVAMLVARQSLSGCGLCHCSSLEYPTSGARQ